MKLRTIQVYRLIRIQLTNDLCAFVAQQQQQKQKQTFAMIVKIPFNERFVIIRAFYTSIQTAYFIEC